MLAPPIMMALAKSPIVKNYDLSSLRFILTGAASITKELCNEVKRKIPSVVQIAQGYGMTEESMASHLGVWGMDNPVSVGRLCANFEMKVVFGILKAEIKFFVL